MKVHTVMKYHVGVPMVVQLTSAAKHDHYLLKEVHLPKTPLWRWIVVTSTSHNSTSYRRRRVLRDQNEENLKYEELESITYVNPQGLVTHIDKKVLLQEGTHP